MTAFALIRRLRRGPLTPALAAALVAGAGLHLAGMALIGLTWRLPAPPAPPVTFVRAQRGDAVLAEQAALLDPSPLFLPTALNHGAGFERPPTGATDAAPLPEPERAISTPADARRLRTPRAAVITEDYARRAPQDQLPAGSGDTFLTFGRESAPSGALPPTGARGVMRDEATGTLLGEIALPAKGLSVGSAELLRPAVFFVETDAYGTSAPVLRESSGDADCDARLAAALAQALAAQPLREGRMRVTATP